MLIGTFAIVALAFAAVGIAGIIGYTVASRTREIGLRIALGSAPRRIVVELVRDGMALIAAGMALGLAGAFAIGRLMASLLYGLSPTDALTLASALTALAIVALVATYVPARRAARIDPLTALRSD